MGERVVYAGMTGMFGSIKGVKFFVELENALEMEETYE